MSNSLKTRTEGTADAASKRALLAAAGVLPAKNIPETAFPRWDALESRALVANDNGVSARKAAR